MQKRLEVCVDSVESAVIAQKGGADRLEVCANLLIGGTTCGVSQFKQIRKLCDIELNVLIRPRFGDFLYTAAEFQMLLDDIEMFQNIGADGVVVGCLKADGTLDLDRMKELRAKADGIHMTLHRAFDVCKDPYRTLQEAVSLNIDTILTSGQASDCMKGKEVLKQLIDQAGDSIEILAGGGVNADVIRQLKSEIHASSFHMSGKHKTESGMLYRNPQVNMGFGGLSEYELFYTEEAKIREARKVLDWE